MDDFRSKKATREKVGKFLEDSRIRKKKKSSKQTRTVGTDVFRIVV